MDKVFLVERIIKAKNGTVMTHPIGSFKEEEHAKQFIADMNTDLMALLQAQLIVATDKGPKATGLTAQAFVATLGIENIGHRYFPIDVKESLVQVAPQPKIILPS